ncbi:MAG: hypothetical protein ACI8Y7_000640 [Candidatus Woesearchaeota archaeon]|jgi:hypothetical protein
MPKHTKEQLVAGALVLLYALIIIFFLGLSGAPALNVFLATLPILIHVVLLITLYLEHKADNWVLWLVPFFLVLLFYLAYASQANMLISSMDGGAIAVWLVIILYGMSIFANILGAKKMRKQVIQDELEQSSDYSQMSQQYLTNNKQYEDHIRKLENRLLVTKQELEVSQENISVRLHDIEAKCKAINFVIGRVYADKRGGNPRTRELLHIPREIYNNFSEAAKNYETADKDRLKDLLTIIKNKLAMYELPENRLFTVSKSPQIETTRDSEGNTAILEVMSTNDNDPIMDYYTETKEVVEKLLTFVHPKKDL